jgi:hypothetical protein
MQKGTKLVHYKGGKYTVLDQGTHSETLEDMIIYQNDKDKKVWIRPLQMFYEEVEFKGEIVPRFKEISIGNYGGVTTVISTLDVGTKFHVCNGVWDGEIILKDGKKHVLIKGDDIENAKPILDDRTLDIEITD